MKTQNSFQTDDSGVLYIVPTPIGNLEDITIRALNTLKSVDLIAAEDTRNTKKLLNHFEINKPLVSYHEHNKKSRETSLLEKLAAGEDIALVSDAGMPAISDPGYEIVAAAIEAEYKVIVLPGANAALCALVGSGISPGEFYFYGFLPRKNKAREEELQRLKKIPAALLFYESPHRLKDTLKSLGILGERKIVIARELTKRYEEYIRGNVTELLEWTENGVLKGEFCIIVEGGDEVEEESDWWKELSIEQHVNYYMEEQDQSSKTAIKKAAEDRKVPKREVYQAYHVK